MNIKIINFQQDSYNPNLKNQQKFLKIKNKQRPTNPTTQRNTHKDRQRGELRRGRERDRRTGREREKLETIKPHKYTNLNNQDPR